jgi:hypothetical protein
LILHNRAIDFRCLMLSLILKNRFSIAMQASREMTRQHRNRVQEYGSYLNNSIVDKFFHLQVMYRTYKLRL